MTVTIHWSEHRRSDLVRALQALSGAAVKASTAGVIVSDEVAARWLLRARTDGNGADASAAEPRNGAVVEILTPPPSPPGVGNDGLNEIQRAALATIRGGDADAIARIHHATIAVLRRRGLIGEQP